MKKVFVVALAVAAIGATQAEGDETGGYVGTQCWVGGLLVPVKGNSCPVDTPADNGGVIIGPPIIIWRHPSAGGSQMPGLTPLNPQGIMELNAIADTAITLRQKADFAMQHGDLVKAKQYLDAASQRDPQDPETQADYVKLQNLFDKGTQSLTVPSLPMKGAQEEVLAPVSPQKYDPKIYDKDPKAKKLRKIELQAYHELSQANAALSDVSAKLAKGAATQNDVSQAQTKFDETANAFKQAHTDLQKRIYVLDQGK